MIAYCRKLRAGEPTVTSHFHGAAAKVWFFGSFPTIVLMAMFPTSPFWVLWLVFVSYYANFVGHWSAKQAVRVEQHADPNSPNP